MSEKDGDEMYINFAAQAPGGAMMGSERVPSDMGHWKMYEGSHMLPKHILYLGRLDDGVDFTVTLMEMDILQVIKHSLSIVGGIVDDFVGRCRIRVSAAGAVTWEMGKETQDLGDVPGGLREIKFTGNNSAYTMQLSVQVHIDK
jgi:hypothetical protein